MATTVDSQPSHVVQEFVQTLHDMLSAINEVFPECPKVALYVATFRGAVLNLPPAQEQAIQRWHKIMGPYYDAVERRDIDTILNSGIEVLDQLGLAEKWYDPDFDEDSKDALWEYLDELNSYAKLYCQLPNGIMRKIEDIAMKIASQTPEGQQPNVNVQQVAADVLMNLGENDLKDFTQSLPTLMSTMMSPENMNMMMQTMQQMSAAGANGQPNPLAGLSQLMQGQAQLPPQ